MKTNILHPSTGNDVSSSMTSESGTVSSTSGSDEAHLILTCRTEWTWDIRDTKLPEITIPDTFDAWPNGPCKRAYCIRTSLEASRHSSGWAMRNTNNHNVNILKKSCLGVLVCNLRCGSATGDESRRSDLVVWRPAICDKARSKQLGQRCRTPGCSGVLKLQGCQGTSGYPVTHFWRKNDRGHVFFQSKGTHNHPRPVKLHANICGEKGRVRLTGNSVGEMSDVRRHGRKPYTRKGLIRRVQNAYYSLEGMGDDTKVIPKSDLDSISDPLKPILKEEEVPEYYFRYTQDQSFCETELLENKLYSYQLPDSVESASLQARHFQEFNTISGDGVRTTTHFAGRQLDCQETEMKWSAQDQSFSSAVSPLATTNSWMSPTKELSAEDRSRIQSFTSPHSHQSTMNSWTSSPNKLSAFNNMNSSSTAIQPIGFLCGVSYSTPTPPLEELHSKHSGVVNSNSLINSQDGIQFQCNTMTNSSGTSSQEVSSFTNNPPSFNFKTKIDQSQSQEEFIHFCGDQLPAKNKCESGSARILPCVENQWSREQWSPERRSDAYYYDSTQTDFHEDHSQLLSLYFESQPTSQTADINKNLWSKLSSFDNSFDDCSASRPSFIRHSLEDGDNENTTYANQSPLSNINTDKYIDSQMTTYRAGYEDSQLFAYEPIHGGYVNNSYADSYPKYLASKFVANERDLKTCSQSTRSSSNGRTDYNNFSSTPEKDVSGYNDEKLFLSPFRSVHVSKNACVYDDDDNAMYPSMANNKFDLYSLADEYNTPLYDKSFASYDEKILDDILYDLDIISR